MIARRVSHPTPFLLVDLNKIREKHRYLQSVLPSVEIFYAMQANAQPRIVRTLLEEGCGVEIASSAELCQLLNYAVPSAKIISSNPVKKPELLACLHVIGVGCMAIDSFAEVDKIAKYAPDSQVYLRLKTDNEPSSKFGVDVPDAPALLRYAASQGLAPCGLTFHAGAQCGNPLYWEAALSACAYIIGQVSGQIDLEVINLGGDLPIQQATQTLALSEIAKILNEAQSSLFDNQIRYQIEPGRFLVEESAVLVSSVIGKATRNRENWLYLDVGVFHGGIFNNLAKPAEHFAYEIDFDRADERPWKTFTIAGPSCDRLDVMFTGKRIPDLQINERLYLRNAGAYTLSHANAFGGFVPPQVVYTDELVAFNGQERLVVLS